MLSQRALKAQPSATGELAAKVTELQRQGRKIISLNIGEPDFPTPENICRAAVAAIKEGFTRYPPITGFADLKEQICKKYLRQGLTFELNEICVCVGAKQAVMNSMLVLCDPGDEVLIPIPCWVSYEEMVRLAGGIPVLVPVNPDDFSLDLAAIERAVTPKTKAIIINTPNNPTGAVYGRAQLQGLAELAARRGFSIVSDEVYEALIYGGEEHVSIASLSEDARSRTLTVNSFSKTYAMTGWRVGYVAARRDIIRAINSIQGQMTSGTCSVSQKAAVEALSGPQDVVAVMRSEFDKRRAYAHKRLNAMRGITCADSKGAFYLMPNVTGLLGKSYKGKPIPDAVALAGLLLEEALIALVPGEAYNYPGHLRISYSNSMQNLETALDRMEEVLRQLQ